MKDEEIYYQRAWHGRGMDFNEFRLEKDLTGAMVHGWGIYTAENKKTAQEAYKKISRRQGVSSYQYEVVNSLY